MFRCKAPEILRSEGEVSSPGRITAGAAIRPKAGLPVDLSEDGPNVLSRGTPQMNVFQQAAKESSQLKEKLWPSISLPEGQVLLVQTW
jgi:hypothetical protein